MTAVLDAESKTLSGVTPFDFVRGNVTVDPTVLAPADWIRLIDAAMAGLSWNDIGPMMPVGELLSRRHAGSIYSEVQSVSQAVLKKTVGGVPPGARFLHIRRLLPTANPMKSTDLLFGQNFDKDEDSQRQWRLYTLEVEWRWMRKQELSGFDAKGSAAKRIALYAMPMLQVIELFGKQDIHSVYLAGRDVLHRLYQAFDHALREVERHARNLREREAYVARILGRTNFGPFVGMN